MSSPCDDKVVAVAHSGHGLHDFTLIVFDDFNSFQALHGKEMSDHSKRHIHAMKTGNSRCQERSTISPCMPSLSAKASTHAYSFVSRPQRPSTCTDINSLFASLASPSGHLGVFPRKKHTFPPSTSSPMIRHAAVWMRRFSGADIFNGKAAGRARDVVMKE